jgi:monoamine oxidase
MRMRHTTTVARGTAATVIHPMAKQPLLSFFLRAHARRSSPHSPGRRRVLQGMVATGAVSALGMTGCPAPTGRRIAIVGGGMAGLHCALRLQRQGIDCTVFEAQARLGGRMFSDRNTFAPLVCELGGELIDTGHQTMIDLAAEFNLTLADFTTDALSATVAFHFEGERVTEAEVLQAYEPIAAAIDEALATIGGDGYVTYDAPNGGEALDAQSIGSYLDQLVTDGVIAADNVAKRLLEVAYTIEYGQPVAEQNLINMLVLISTALDDFAEFGDSDERYTIVGGNDQLITAMATELAGHIEPGYALEGMSKRSDGAIELSFRVDGAVVTIVADTVVMTLPFRVLRELDLSPSLGFSATKLRAINEIGYGNNSKLMVGFSSRVWREGDDAFGGSSYSDTGYQATWETSRLQDGTAGILTNFTGAQRALDAGNGTPAAEAARFLQELEVVVPGIGDAADGRVARFHWPSNAFVKGSYACYLPGQYTAFSGVEGESDSDGAVLFAGEHTSLDAQGYMEGAALTGAAAAEAIIATTGTAAAALVGVAGPAERIRARAREVMLRGHHRRRR